MGQRLQVHKLLNAEQLAELEAWSREPGRTIDQTHEFLLAKGFTLSRTAVANWKEQFDGEDKIRRAAAISHGFLAAGKESGATDIASASLLRFQQMVFEHLVGSTDADAGDLMRLSIALKTAVQAGQHIEELQAEYARKNKAAADEAAKLAKAGGSGEAVVAKVREILGIDREAA